MSLVLLIFHFFSPMRINSTKLRNLRCRTPLLLKERTNTHPPKSVQNHLRPWSRVLRNAVAAWIPKSTAAASASSSDLPSLIIVVYFHCFARLLMRLIWHFTELFNDSSPSRLKNSIIPMVSSPACSPSPCSSPVAFMQVSSALRCFFTGGCSMCAVTAGSTRGFSTGSAFTTGTALRLVVFSLSRCFFDVCVRTLAGNTFCLCRCGSTFPLCFRISLLRFAISWQRCHRHSCAECWMCGRSI